MQIAAPWQQVPNLHHVFYRSGTDRYGRFWINFHCQHCRDLSEKQCMSPARVTKWVATYAIQHRH